jgi:hypothetical protein
MQKSFLRRIEVRQLPCLKRTTYCAKFARQSVFDMFSNEMSLKTLVIVAMFCSSRNKLHCLHRPSFPQSVLCHGEPPDILTCLPAFHPFASAADDQPASLSRSTHSICIGQSGLCHKQAWPRLPLAMPPPSSAQRKKKKEQVGTKDSESAKRLPRSCEMGRIRCAGSLSILCTCSKIEMDYRKGGSKRAKSTF